MDIKFQIYIISHGRHERGEITAKNFTNYKHVVRESEKAIYKKHGFKNVVGYPDEDINSYTKVFNYLVDNAPEDVIAIVDDDIDHFLYRTDKSEIITDSWIVQQEFERIAQMIADLRIGLAMADVLSIPYSYSQEFTWGGVPGAWKIINRSVIKARMDSSIARNVDIDYVLQEMLKNRICLKVKYLCSFGYRDESTTTSGSNYDGSDIEASLTEMKLRWGKYFNYNKKRGIPYIHVPR